jgi:peptidoglycan/LPS O-acetylase OafA/YrhL
MACSRQGFESLAFSHAATYLFTFWLAVRRSDNRKFAFGLIALAQLLLGILLNDVMLNGALAIISLTFFTGLGLPNSRLVDWLANKSYFFYLIHGPIIVVLASLFPSHVALVVSLAILIGWAGASALERTNNRLLEFVLPRLSRAWGGT